MFFFVLVGVILTHAVCENPTRCEFVLVCCELIFTLEVRDGACECGSRIWLYAGSLTCGHARGRTTDGVQQSTASLQGAATHSIPTRCSLPLGSPIWGFTSWRARSLPSSYMGIAALSLFWLFLSSPPACICLISIACIAITLVQ